MIVLAIDLGDTTGYAYVRKLNDGVALLHYGVSPLGRPMPGRFKPDVVVIERPAYIESRRQEDYAEAIHRLKVQYGKKVRVVQPADWMQRFNRFPLPGRGVLESQHEKDAWRMAVWACEKFGGGDG